VQYEYTLCERFLTSEVDKRDFERILAPQYKGDIEIYMSQKTYYNTKLGLKGPAWVAQIDLGLPSWFKDYCAIQGGRTSDKEVYEEAITVIGLHHWERFREIEHKKKLDKAHSMKYKGMGKEFSKSESSNHNANRQKPYDKLEKKT
jgi:hypothetical protein